MNPEILLHVVQKDGRCVLTATHAGGASRHPDLVSWVMDLCAFMKRTNPEWTLESFDGGNACCTVLLTRTARAA